MSNKILYSSQEVQKLSDEGKAFIVSKVPVLQIPMSQ